MAFIDNCRKGIQDKMIYTVCLEGNECKILQPIISRAIRKAKMKVEHYEDLVCDGYGTTLQENKLVKWQDKLSALESIQKTLNDYLK